MFKKVFNFGNKVLWMFGIYILYQLAMVPFLLPSIRKFNWTLNVLFGVIGVALSLMLVIYIWKHFDGDFKVQVPFIKKWTKKKKILVYLILLVILLVGGYLAGFLPTADNQTEIEKMFQKNQLVIVISTVVCAPFIEELIFRGILQKLFFQKIETKRQMILYVIISTGLFVWIHGPQFNLEMIPYILMGLIFSLTYILLGDIKYDISLHMINNVVAMIFLFLN